MSDQSELRRLSWKIENLERKLAAANEDAERLALFLRSQTEFVSISLGYGLILEITTALYEHDQRVKGNQ